MFVYSFVFYFSPRNSDEISIYLTFTFFFSSTIHFCYIFITIFYCLTLHRSESIIPLTNLQVCIFFISLLTVYSHYFHVHSSFSSQFFLVLLFLTKFLSLLVLNLNRCSLTLTQKSFEFLAGSLLFLKKSTWEHCSFTSCMYVLKTDCCFCVRMRIWPTRKFSLFFFKIIKNTYNFPYF